MKTIKVEAHDDDTSVNKSSTSGKKSVLELLELQMRARIIKTMLEKNDGTALTEDALVALMESAEETTQITKIANEVKGDIDAGTDKAKDTKDDDKGQESREFERKKSSDGKRHRDGSKSSRSERKKEHHHRKGSKRQRSTTGRDSDGDSSKHYKRDRSSDKRVQKKKKITRREFEERMKRAKKNRSYRQRKSSDDEEKIIAGKNKEKIDTSEVDGEGKAEEKAAESIKTQGNEGEGTAKKEEGEAVSEKEEGEAVSEKEEGECDSDDDEEGACSPSDISSGSYYSSRSYSSRSRSRSYSRSYSRSPVRRRGRGKSRSRTRSRSRSRSNERRKDSGRWPKKKTRDHGNSGTVKMSAGTVSLPNSSNQKSQKEEEDNWGQSCDIEFVESEEDFDDTATDSTKNISVDSKKPLPIKGQNSDRASISFSLQKKTVPSITPNVDLDDLPLKSSSLGIRKQRRNLDVEVITENEETKQSQIIDLDSPKLPTDEILISSDSEQEMKDPAKTKSVRVERRELIPSVAKSESSKAKLTISKQDNSNHPLSSDIIATNESVSAHEKLKENDAVTGSSVDTPTVSTTNEVSNLERCKQSDQICGDNFVADEVQKQNEDIKIHDTSHDDSDGNAEENQENSSNYEDQIAGIENENENITVGKSNADKNFIENQEHQDMIDVDNGNTSEGTYNNIHEPKKDVEIEGVKEMSVSKLDEEEDIVFTGVSHKDTAKANTIQQDEEIKGEDSLKNFSKVSNLASVPDNKKIIASGLEEGNMIDKVTETQSSNIDSVQESHKEIKRQVVLEHLHESYNEEEGFSIQESYEEDNGNCSLKTCAQESDPKVTGEITSEDKNISEELTCITTEGNTESHDEVLEESDEHLEEEGKENSTISISQEQAENSEENDNHDVNQGASDDFYKGADQLTFSDDDTGDCDQETIDDIRNREVEPIRINTGLIRRHVTRSKKIEMGAPAKSWTKKERKKKEKPTDVLAMEGIGLLKQSLAESVQSPLSKEDDPQGSEGKEGEQTNDDDTCTSWGVSSISSKEETSMDSRAQSPKENEIKTSGESPKSGNDEANETVDFLTGAKKTGETEIIGIIEANSTPDDSQIEDIDVGGSSWSMRWLRSEKVQKVVSSSKMLSRVRKKIQKKDKATKVAIVDKPELPVKKLPEPVVPIIGSIEEYERLFGMKAKKPAHEPESTASESTRENMNSGECSEQVSGSSQQTLQPQKKKTSFGSDDEGEDSEEEALWSKILRK